MATRIGVAIMAIVFALYIWLLGGRAVALIGAGINTEQPIAIVMGAAMIVFPLLGLWALARELWFGWRGDRLARQLGEEGLLPDEEVSLRPSGGVVRADADALFPAYQQAVEAEPDSWRAWFRLGIVYDAAGDRKRARAATRQAIRLAKHA